MAELTELETMKAALAQLDQDLKAALKAPRGETPEDRARRDGEVTELRESIKELTTELAAVRKLAKPAKRRDEDPEPEPEAEPDDLLEYLTGR